MTTTGHLNPFYQPKIHDLVIGIIDKKNGEEWLVDIGFYHFAILPQLSFEGATKKNCPKFKHGDLVAALVESVPEAGEVVLTCISKKIPNLGGLTGGTLLRSRMSDIERVIQYGFLDKVSLEKIFAKNGRVYIKGDPVKCIQTVHFILTALKSDDPVSVFDQMLKDTK
ncbi:Exosome complex component RRP40 [Histomonas meleagridis]|uniref:Exosome complex component RRP40 n=1 Tax=Histomonas meleagridis TaxID=135588 RepID=UPI00355A7BEA|nr:Exosome complex component RRP40 [Histomonas meleagridis]KAH0800763.1 Exosome complex component RRP40 [Histomonas meleagridis]